MKHTYDYPRPALTADCVVFAVVGKSLKALLVQRGEEPFKGEMAIPGGFVHEGETAREAAARELHEETGLVLKAPLEDCGVWTEPGRDPRGWVVSAAFWTIVPPEEVRGGSDAAAATWVDIQGVEMQGLAFDHAKILARALKGLRERVRRAPVGFNLLPERFTLTDLQTIYEAVLSTTTDKRNFRKKVLRLGVLRRHREVNKGSRRPAALFSFDAGKYAHLVTKGIDFEI